MGSGPRPKGAATASSSRRGLVDDSGSPIVDCDVEGRVGADALVAIDQSLEGTIQRSAGEVVMVTDGEPVAVLESADLTARIAVCLERGKRYVGTVNSSIEGRVVVDVRPAEAA